MKTLSTIQVAKLLGVTPATLHRWIREKRIDAPPLQSLAGMEVRVWSEQEIERVKKHKSQHYWGKGARKKRRKRSK